MTNPTVFGINGNSLMVGGEAGDEAILPLAEFYNKLNNILDKKLDAVQKSNIVYVTNHTYIDGDEVASRTVSKVDAETRGQEIALDVLAAAQPKKLYILLGTNTLTTLGASDRFLAYYGQMLDELRQTLGEDCIIYVQSIPPVRPAAAEKKPGLASDVLRGVNEQLAQLAASKGCVYLDLWEALADGEGNLKEMIAAPDGVHLSAGNGYGAWVTYLRNHAKYSASNPWIMGSAYSAE